MPATQPKPTAASPKPKSPSASRVLISTPTVLHEALTVLAAENKTRGKRSGVSYSGLLQQLGRRYAMQPDKLLALRRAGFKKIDELLAL
jgi:hypothetical protein